MSMIQRVAQVFGWVFVVIALWGFFVSGGSMVADPAVAPKVMGLFPVNLLHNLVHLGFGVWGVLAARSIAGARGYALWAGVIYLTLALLGLVIPTTFGLIPIGGNDIWLHALIAVVLLGAWAASRSATATPATTTTTTTTTTATPPPQGYERPAAPAPREHDRPAAPPQSHERPAAPPPSQERPAAPPPHEHERPSAPPPPPSGDPDRNL